MKEDNKNFKGDKFMDNERHEVLGQIVEATGIVCDCLKVSKLIPEVRSNIVMCINNPKTPQDVAGIPGRLTVVNGRVTACAYPSWAASVNTSMVLIWINKFSPDIRAVMEIRYSGALIELLKTNGFILYEIPDSKSWESTIKNGLEANNEGLPIFYSKGDFAREGAVVVCEKDAVSVAKKVVKIAELI